MRDNMLIKSKIHKICACVIARRYPDKAISNEWDRHALFLKKPFFKEARGFTPPLLKIPLFKTGIRWNKKMLSKKTATSKNGVGGFTLIEILIYTAVLIILTGALTSFFIWSIDTSAKIKTKQTTLKESQRAMDKILFEIKEAQSVYTPTSVFEQHPGQLSLKTTHEPPIGEASTFIDFYLCGEQICVKKEGYEAVPLTSNKTIVEKLFFTRLSASSTESVQVNLELKYNTPNNKPAWQASTSLTSTATIRNHE